MPRNRHRSKPNVSRAAEKRIEHLKVELFLGVLVLVLFTVVKLQFEHSGSGSWLASQAHLVLQRKIRPANYDLPVMIVDITDLRRSAYHVTNGPSPTLFFTPREDLDVLIGNIASKNPLAIGVDIDLSTEPELKLETELVRASENLFDHALGLTNSRGSPIVVFGVKRNEGREPVHWLGRTNYVALAASLARPKGLVLRMPSEFEFPGHTNRLPSLSKALAALYRESNVPTAAPRSGLVDFLARPISVEMPLTGTPDFRVSEFAVDYSPMNTLVGSHVVPFEKAAGAPASTFQNKIVLIGDARQFQGADTAIVPGEQEPMPGVFVQACATFTLAMAPLLKLRPVAGMIFTFASSFAGLLLIHWICRKFASKHAVTTIPLTILATFVTMGFFLLVAWLAVVFLRILWLEVIIVCVFLVLECLAELFLTNLNLNWTWAHRVVQFLATAGGFIYAPAAWLRDKAKVTRTALLKTLVIGAHKKQ